VGNGLPKGGLKVDKIQYYNDLVEIEGKPDLTTQNFLDGIMFYFHNIDFFYTFLKALGKNYESIVIFPSFCYSEENSSSDARMEKLIFRVEGKNNEAISKMLNKKLDTIKNRHGQAKCTFTYNKKDNKICLEIHDIKLTKGEIKSVTKNQYSK
jgi:hypothetical protein